MNTVRKPAIRPALRPTALALCAGLALIASSAAAAAEAVGRVTSVGGLVTASREGTSSRSLSIGESIYAGDRVRTGSRGRVQLRFSDGGMVQLDPRSTFAVATYEQGGDDEGGNVLMSFLRGAMRTLTGAVGAGPRDRYRLTTSVATIGVRGTEYALELCDSECAAQGGERGLYGRVDGGAIRVETPAGTGTWSSGRFFHVPEGGPARSIVAPPPGVLDGAPTSAGAETDGDGDDVGSAIRLTGAQVAPVEAVAPGALLETAYTSADASAPEIEASFDGADDFAPGDDLAITGIGGAGVAAAGIETNEIARELATGEVIGEEGPFVTDGDGRVTEADLATLINSDFDSPVSVATATVTLAESATIDDLGVQWGRWAGTLSADDGSLATTLFGNLAFAVSDNFTEPAQLSAMNGTIGYALDSGPSAFDAESDRWSVGTLDLAVDFDAVAVDLASFELTEVGDDNNFVDAFTFDGTNVTGQTLDLGGNALALELDCTDCTLSGRFVGLDAEGAIVVFRIRDSDGVERVTGTKILRR